MSDEKKDVTEEPTADEAQAEAQAEEGSGSEKNGAESAEESKDATADAAEDADAPGAESDDANSADDADAESAQSDDGGGDDADSANDADAKSAPSDDDAASEQAADSDAHDSDAHDSDAHHSDAHDSDAHDSDAHDDHHGHADDGVLGIAAFFDHPDHLVYAAGQAREAEYQAFDAYSPFPIHGMDDAMGLGRSWIPWVTFFAGGAGFTTANILQFGIMFVDWPMVFGGKPFNSWPSFVPIMFELTVLFAGVTTAIVMLIAAGCFRKPLIIDPGISNDRFVLWISSQDEQFDRDRVIEFMKELNPMEIRTIRKEGRS